MLLNRYTDSVVKKMGYSGQHFWSRGYCVSTVGLDEERIKKYVKWQRHKDQEADATQGNLFD